MLHDLKTKSYHLIFRLVNTFLRTSLTPSSHQNVNECKQLGGANYYWRGKFANKIESSPCGGEICEHIASNESGEGVTKTMLFLSPLYLFCGSITYHSIVIYVCLYRILLDFCKNKRIFLLS